jgi:hypothetical protein
VANLPASFNDGFVCAIRAAGNASAIINPLVFMFMVANLTFI